MKHDLNNKNFERKAKRVYSVFACVTLLLAVTAVPALAAHRALANVIAKSFFFIVQTLPFLFFSY